MKQFFIAADQLINTCIYIPGEGWGMADETLSARAWRLHRAGRPRLARCIDAVLFFDPDHCYESWLSEKQRKQLPTEYAL